ncbi:MAG TPA: WecB/TagA/CpsF family glycosyltransferase [Xenococcaceae cyanobacterium]
MLQLDNKIPQPKIFSVLGLPVHLLDDYTHWLYHRLNQGIGTHVVTLNAEMAMLARQEPNFAQIISQAELVIPDGAGVILYMRLRGFKHQRCPGIELAEALLQTLAQTTESYSVCFYGGTPGTAGQAANMWQNKIPQLTVLAQHGYLSEDKQQVWQDILQQEQPQIIFVGLGVPRQEFWIREHRHLCPNSTWIGVGGSLDIWAGSKTRAPSMLRNNNLEWFYRLYQEPWRWKRMLALPQFFWLSLLNRS